MANKFDPNGWDKSPSVNNGGFVPWSRGIDLTPEQKMIAGKNIGIVTDAQIDSLIDQFHDLDGRVNVTLDNVDTALETVSSLSGDVESALTGAQQALDTVNTITANFDVLSGKVDSNAANISSNSADISTNSSNIGTLSAKEQIDRTDINAISGNVGTNAYNIGNLSAKVNTISGNVYTLQSDVSGIKIDITGMNSRLNTVSGIADNALASGQDALNKANAISAQWTVVSGDIEDLKDDWSAFSAAEDAVITAATAAIPGQVSAEVSGQLSGKQDKLVNSVNITVLDNKVDLHNNECSATPNSVAIGDKSKSINNFGFVHGRYATNAGQFNAMVAAFNESASGTYNLVAGNQNVVAGNWNTVVGSGNSVTANNFNFLQGIGNTVGNVQGAHAEGNATSAMGSYSHAEGYNTRANGQFSHAEGQACNASGNGSHAEGQQTTAVGLRSHAEGRGTITDTNYQHVEGQYNAPASGALHVIGNGTTTAQRSNIVETYTDRVVVNGDLINDTKDQVLAQFMFDQMPATQTEGKLITQELLPSGQYVINEYVVGNYEISKVGGFTGSQSPACTTPGGTILAWDGNVGQAMRGQYTSNWTPTAWPTDKLPRNVYNSNNTLSWSQFASYNMNLKELPSGWYNSFTAYCDEASASLYHVSNMFKGCKNLSGDVKPWMDFILTQSGAGEAGNSAREFYRKGMFALCSAVDNYATLSADPTYSAFFDPS